MKYLILLVLFACSQPSLRPPMVAKKMTPIKNKFETRLEPYYWIRDVAWTQNRQKNLKFKDMKKEVREYLLKEQAYADAILRPIQSEKEKIFQEIKNRIPDTDQSYPYERNGYWYYTRYEEGNEYPIYCRKRKNLSSAEEIYLDPNIEAKGKQVYKIGFMSISPDNRLMAFNVDTKGNRIYTLYFKDLETNKLLTQKIENSSSSFEWASDSKSFFLIEMNPKSLRYEKLHRYNLANLTRELVFHEKNPELNLYIWESQSQEYLFLSSSGSDESEQRYLKRNNTGGRFKLFKKIEPKLKYSVNHINDRFYIKSNRDNENFDLFYVPESSPQSRWQIFLKSRQGDYIQNFALFTHFIALEIRRNGIKNIKIMTHDKKENYELTHPDSGYALGLYQNYNPQAYQVRFYYETPITPEQTIEWDTKSRKRLVLKTKAVGGNYRWQNYTSERRFVKVRDGALVPITIVRAKSTIPSPQTPVLLYGYGSYGSNIEPYFRQAYISLLDRGFAYVVAHVRGSSFLGRHWYLNGKFTKKKNTFNDFVDVARYLIDEKMTSPRKLFAKGGSAGGLLMGVVANQAPFLFRGMVANVPFVDVLTTMLDEDLPLTTEEYQEWGNPNQRKYYNYIKSYSPIDNVKMQRYPRIFATGSIHDTQVGYWEPGKWVATLREKQVEPDNPIIYKVELETGHSGESGRFKSYQSLAEVFALLDHWASD